VAKKTAPLEKTLGGARTAFTDEQLAHIKATFTKKSLEAV
jgi:hypothetical protein